MAGPTRLETVTSDNLSMDGLYPCCFLQVVSNWRPSQKRLVVPKKCDQSERLIRGHRSLARNDLVNPTRWNSNFPCETVLADSQGSEELFQEHLARTDVLGFFAIFPSASMAVDDLDFVGVATQPNEASSPWVMDPYAVVAAAPPFQASKRFAGGTRRSVK